MRIMIKSSLASFLLLVFVSPSFSTVNPADRDMLVTLKGDTIFGNAEINLARKWVEIRGEEVYRMIQFKNIYSLQLHNTKGETVTEYRQYDDIDRTTKGHLLRQVVKGDVHFLVKSVPRVYDSYAMGVNLRDSKQVVENDYYIWCKGDLRRVMNFRKQMMQLCETTEQQEALRDYVKKYKLRYAQPTDQVTIVKELNRLRQNSATVASLK